MYWFIDIYKRTLHSIKINLKDTQLDGISKFVKEECVQCQIAPSQSSLFVNTIIFSSYLLY